MDQNPCDLSVFVRVPLPVLIPNVHIIESRVDHLCINERYRDKFMSAIIRFLFHEDSPTADKIIFDLRPVINQYSGLSTIYICPNVSNLGTFLTK